MTRVIIALLAVGLSFSLILISVVYAQENSEDLTWDSVKRLHCTSGTALSELKQREWLNALQSRYKTLKTIIADFVQVSYLRSLDLAEQSSGKMWFQNAGKLRWEYAHPEKQIFLVRDEIFELYQPLEQQLVRQTVKSYFSSQVPVAFLLGFGDLESSFHLLKGCSIGKEVVLFLRSKRDPSHTEVSHKEDGETLLAVAIDAEEKIPTIIEIEDGEKNLTTFRLALDTIDSPIQAERFTIQLPDGVDVQERTT